ncbi:MAG: alpha/beta hydrolase [Novosphingobium sp.]
MPNADRLPKDDGVVTENYVKLSRGGIRYLEAGPVDGPLLIFIHGWPELAISYRHQLPVFGQLGFRAIAPDMPGFGGSAVHQKHEDYALEKLNRDMAEFVDALGAGQAVWIGHDWGSLVVWSFAAHYPEKCSAVASLCVPYRTVELGVDHLITTVDRSVYDPQEHPAGPWDYMLFYQESFDRARKVFERDTEAFFRFMFGKGDPKGFDQPTITAGVRKRGGWFGNDASPPEAARDDAIVDQNALSAYVAAYRRSGFFGADSYYMNHEANAEYASRSVNGGRLDMPVLFVSADYDYWCDTVRNTVFGEEMRRLCSDLTAFRVPAGHWIMQEEPTKVNSALCHWLATRAKVWPDLPAPDWKPID